MSDSSNFQSIGVCFSGGGYRASAFSLGVLSYLDHIQFQGKPLLEQVIALSTVSGGSITGAAFAASQSSGSAFSEFYENFYAFLREDKLLEMAIRILESGEEWKKTTKKRTLINAFALAYERLIYQKTDFTSFQDSSMKGHLKQVCFNATDFSFGLAFRFQNSGMFGNKPLNCAELNKICDHVKVADAVASSSCFPFGFEPLIFPDDYFEDQTSADYLALKQSKNFVEGVGIMDGGIVDNQGIGSMVHIDSRLKGTLGLMIINDVGSYKMDPWLQGSGVPGKKGSVRESLFRVLNFFRIRWYYWSLMLLGITLIVCNALGVFGTKAINTINILGGIVTGIGLITTVAGIVLSVIRIGGALWFRSFFKSKVPGELIDDVTSLGRLDISLVKRMLTERMTSAFKMINDIFLKQIRRLNYDLVYASDKFKDRVITSTVYQLNGQETLYKANRLNPNIPAPSQPLKDMALIASETPTTLWWDEKDRKLQRLNSLVACGQFTTCYSLIDFILKLPADKQTADILQMKNDLLKDWNDFNKKPDILV